LRAAEFGWARMAERASGRSSRGRNPEAAPKWAAVALTRLLYEGPHFARAAVDSMGVLNFVVLFLA